MNVVAFAGRLPLVSATLLAGCLIIPTDYHQAGSRHNVSADVQPKIEVGVTTKEEVFLLLGEPDEVSDDGQHLGYKWTKVNAIVIIGGYYTAGGFEVARSHVLRLTFDADNRVSDVRTLSAWGSVTPVDAPPKPPG